MAGYWLNPERNQCVQVATTHDEWVRDRANADALGLPEAVYEEIMSYRPADIDPIRLAAVRFGLVRIREHRWHVSVQYWAETDRVEVVLGAVVRALTGLGIHPDTWLIVDNLLLKDSLAMTLRELETTLPTRSRAQSQPPGT